MMEVGRGHYIPSNITLILPCFWKKKTYGSSHGRQCTEMK